MTNDRPVLSIGVRTPIGHVAKGLAAWWPEDLLETALRGLFQKAVLSPEDVDGVLAGWVGQGSHAPNIARVAAIKAGVPVRVPAFTVQANCVSGLECVASACRHIATGEGTLFLAAGTESMSQFPFAIRGNRSHKLLRSLQTLKEKWADVPGADGLTLTDTTEEGLTDPVAGLNMAATAELCAMAHGIDRDQEDAYALDSYAKALSGEENGFYAQHTIPCETPERPGLARDEYPYLRKQLVEKPGMMGKAPLLFQDAAFRSDLRRRAKFLTGKDPGERPATVTLFNACPRSDGAAALIVTTEKRAAELGLPVLAYVKSWGFTGNDPSIMGVSPVEAANTAVKRAGVPFSAIRLIELHEAFAATCLSIFRLGREKYGQDWEAPKRDGRYNPNGGSIALGHPLAATGIRLLLNLVFAMRDLKRGEFGLAAACASGGLGGAVLLEKA